MSSELRQLIRERKLVRIVPNRKMILKEIEGAERFLEKAKQILRIK